MDYKPLPDHSHSQSIRMKVVTLGEVPLPFEGP